MASITSIKLRQIDFLRLFRLCKSMGLVARKRKMPTEYLRDSECKNASKRLLMLVVKDTFKDQNVHSGYSGITVSTSGPAAAEFRTIVNAVLSPNYYPNNGRRRVQLPPAAHSRLDELSNGVPNFGNGHVSLNFPHSISFNYRSYRNDIGGRKDSFYRCALDCIAFKRHWDESVDIIRAAYNEATRPAQPVPVPTPAAQVPPEGTIAAAVVIAAVVPTVTEQAQMQVQEQQATEEHRQEVQRMFDDALAVLMRNRPERRTEG